MVLETGKEYYPIRNSLSMVVPLLTLRIGKVAEVAAFDVSHGLLN